jgi:2-polyprenyl-3-methyl-5-hydroxy-6-metoxy-1,4-benzoquinol methylase
MDESEKQKLIERYNERLKKYGYDPRTIGWLKGRQPIRFKILSEIGDLSNCSILDVGCGFGDLYGFLTKRGLTIEYTGVDINPTLIEIAKNIYPHVQFEVKDFQEDDMGEFDWVFSSGVFNFRLPDNESFIQTMLKKMFGMCKKGIAADFLSSYVEFRNEDAYYTCPEDVFRVCKTLSRRATLRHDYMPFEFCVYIYRDDHIDERNVFTDFLESMNAGGL